MPIKKDILKNKEVKKVENNLLNLITNFGNTLLKKHELSMKNENNKITIFKIDKKIDKIKGKIYCLLNEKS